MLNSLLALPLRLPPCYLAYQRSLWMVPKGFRVRIHVSLVPSGKLKYTSMINCSTNNQIEVVPPKTSLFVVCSFNLESIFWMYHLLMSHIFHFIVGEKIESWKFEGQQIEWINIIEISLFTISIIKCKKNLHYIVSSFDCLFNISRKLHSKNER